MATAKDIILRPIDVTTAREVVQRYHYSGKYDTRSQLNIGVFLGGSLEGAIQFGPSLDKHKVQGLVDGAGWNEWLDLHRMAFSDKLPRNSESRALSISMKLIKKHAPQVKFVISYADATQSGDGAIYRASGFVLTKITRNNSMWLMPDGNVICKIVLEPGFSVRKGRVDKGIKSVYGKTGSETSTAFLKRIGATPLPGFQLRYIYFIDPSYRARLTVPELPFSAIDAAGARMYKGQKLDTPPVNGDTLTTSQAGRFDSDPEALDSIRFQNG